MNVIAHPGLQGLPAQFDAATYLELNPDVAAAGMAAEAHFLAYGRAEGRVWRADPLPPGFDPAQYLALNPDLRRAGVDPALHFRTFGRKEGRFCRIADPQTRPRRDPLVVYVHIGKTAGSSLNEVLYATLGPGIRHAETLQGDPWALAQQVQQSGWISGHLVPHQLIAMLGGVTRRPLRLFSVVRRPVDQVASAYNWLLVLHRRGPAALATLTPQTRAAVEAVAGADNSDAAAVIANLDRHGDLFLNSQARTVFDTSAEALTAAEMRQQLERYESIRLQEEIGLLAAEMTGRPGITVPRENASPYHFDKAVFRHPDVLAFLDRANAADTRLVSVVRERAARAPTCATGG